MVKNPKYPRLIFSNEILSKIHAAAYGTKGKFEEYLRYQAQKRWTRKLLFEKIENKKQFLKGKSHKNQNYFPTYNNRACGYYTKSVFFVKQVVTL